MAAAVAAPAGLLGLSDELLLAVAESAGSARDLVALRCVCRRTRALPLEFVAERALAAHAQGWRVRSRGRASESPLFLLDVLQRRLAPLPTVAAGGRHTIVASGTELWGFGTDEDSQLGMGDSDEPVPQPLGAGGNPVQAQPARIERLSGGGATTVSTIAGSEFCLALTRESAAASEAELWAWGWAGTGAASAGACTEFDVIRAPRRVPKHCFAAGDTPALVASSATHAALLTAKGQLCTWGAAHRPPEEQHKLGHALGQQYVWAPRPVEALIEKRFVSVDCGDAVTAAVDSQGQLYVLGKLILKGSEGGSINGMRLHRPAPVSMSVPVRGVACGEAHIVAWSRDGRLFTYGGNSSGQLGHGQQSEEESAPREVRMSASRRSPPRFVSASCGDLFTAAITASGALYTWGHGGHGRLGHGPRFSAKDCCYTPRQVERFNDAEGLALSQPGRDPPSVAEVSCGWTHSVLKLTDGRVCAWGQGNVGQLGQGAARRVDCLVPTIVELPRE